MIAKLNTTLKWVHRLEDGLLISALASMLFTALMQIVLRNFFDSGIFWAESFLRILVLWVAMLGAMVATREANHISIDALSRYLKPKLKRYTVFISQLFSALICATVAYHSFKFLKFEYEDQTIAFGVVPTWVCQAVIPVGFVVIACRFLLQSFTGLTTNLSADSTTDITTGSTTDITGRDS
ncbi:MAG: TRAP transporter small permease [Pseudomonadales bacterium]|nr:TRAP transporter small permease [Pseudomonadales bacterium]